MSRPRDSRPGPRAVVPRNQILLGDALEQLRSVPDCSVDCVVTSPPFFRLRNYQMARQLGLEATVEEFVDRLVAVCDEIARVLKPTGSCFLNLGDSYSRHQRFGALPKSLLLVPERVALRLVEHGWIIRNRICWSKPNPMPSSVTDRLSCTHETIYFLVRSRSYYFDLDAIREPHSTARRGLTAAPRLATTRTGPGKYAGSDRRWAGPLAGSNSGLARARAEGRAGHRLGKNPGDVWRVATAGFRGAHFATFPERLIVRPILAGCPARSCGSCGAPWQHAAGKPIAPSCSCGSSIFQRGLVLDPFLGAGTTAVVAQAHGRDWLGIELNPAYRTLAIDRITASVVRSSTNARGGGARTQGAPRHAPTHPTSPTETTPASPSPLPPVERDAA